ncbi:MAG: hypothetical protein ACRC2V_24905 [Xenococcaceae cyanobacterium]
MGRTKRRERLWQEVVWAQKMQVRAIGKLPNAGAIVRQTAIFWDVAICEVNENMLIAMLRHQYTNYDSLIEQLRRRLETGSHKTIFAEASGILKDNANIVARRLYKKIFGIKT